MRRTFTISFVLFLVTAISLCFCARQINTQHTELQSLSRRVDYLESRRRIVDLSMQLLLSFDLTNGPEREQFEKVLWMLENLPPTLPEQDPELSEIGRQLSMLLRTKAELHKIDEDGELELLSMQWNSLSVPGGIATVLAVFENGKFVDRVVREETTRLESSHKLSVTDLDRDGFLDVAIDIKNGCWGPGDQRVEYSIDNSGFSSIGKL